MLLNTDLIWLLKSFNRKERFFLVGQALGNKEFRISEDFRKIISDKIGLEIPPDAFAAMDYHLDWIYASLYCAEKGTTEFIADNPLGLNSNQEDVDFIIAFNKNGVSHIVLIEAKAESGWTNKQLGSKADKLKSIFGFNRCLWENIKVYFLITSPRKPVNLRIDALPEYLQSSMDDIWFNLDIPDNLIKITRCDEVGKASITGNKWKVERR